MPTYFSLPLVGRELRSQARSRGTFTLRSLVAVVLLSVIIFVGANGGFHNLQGQGPEFFGVLASMIFYGLMLVAPTITAGCITTEREGGTLGLLFLSSLRSFDIVAGKFASNFFRLFSFAVAGMPVLAVTMMMGGVTWAQVTGAGISIMALLVVTVAVSVFTSAVCKKTQTAVFLAFAYLMTINFGLWLAFYWYEYKFKTRPPDWILLLSPADSMFEQFKWTRQNYLAWAGMTLGVACAQALLFLLLASWWLPGTLAVTGNEESAGLKWRRFLKKRFGFKSKRRMRRFLEHNTFLGNPMNWLEIRRFSLGATLFVLIFFGWIFLWILKENTGAVEGSLALIFMFVGFPMHLLLSASAIGSICREITGERRERTLELLLCTPLTESQIMWAKLRGAWARYGLLYLIATLPAAGSVLWCLFVGAPHFFTNDYGQLYWILAESAEDVTYCFMLFAVAFRFAFNSRSAPNAILKSVSAIAGLLLLWGLASILFVGAAHGSDNRIWLMVLLKIAMEVIVAILFLRALPNQLREQCGMTAEAT